MACGKWSNVAKRHSKVKLNSVVVYYIFVYMSEHGGLVGSILSCAHIFHQHVTMCLAHVTEIYKLVCVLLLLTKESHDCG